MNNDPSLRSPIGTGGDERRSPEAADTEGHIRAPIGTGGDERRSPEAADTEGHRVNRGSEVADTEVRLGDDEDTEGHRKI
jgi:hypothetical protein